MPCGQPQPEWWSSTSAWLAPTGPAAPGFQLCGKHSGRVLAYRPVTVKLQEADPFCPTATFPLFISSTTCSTQVFQLKKTQDHQPYLCPPTILHLSVLPITVATSLSPSYGLTGVAVALGYSFKFGSWQMESPACRLDFSHGIFTVILQSVFIRQIKKSPKEQSNLA